MRNIKVSLTEDYEIMIASSKLSWALKMYKLCRARKIWLTLNLSQLCKWRAFRCSEGAGEGRGERGWREASLSDVRVFDAQFSKNTSS